ncbi:hypothetical protein PIB30_079437 [Stylosanthes scabra]|uniref:GAG-pre-integrase domain-containing protein n=1 Tax=Stylosanthes scabra TaxID=79078 RepID=A0ABU6UQL2_9FABA|nr:hypothetical protein [Stylosanthes scabra]
MRDGGKGSTVNNVTTDSADDKIESIGRPGGIVSGSPEDCFTKEMIGVAEQRRGLYAFEKLKPVESASTSINSAITSIRTFGRTSSLDSTQAWHLRLGHIPSQKLHVTRALMLHANLPKNFWNIAAAHVIHIINRLPTTGNCRDKPTIEFDPEIEKTLKKNRSRIRELFNWIKKRQIPKMVLLKNLLKKS